MKERKKEKEKERKRERKLCYAHSLYTTNPKLSATICGVSVCICMGGAGGRAEQCSEVSRKL